MSHPVSVPNEVRVGEQTGEPETLRRAIALVRVLRDPALPGVLFLLSLAAIGCVVLALAVHGSAGTPWVPLQVPYLVSGGFGGGALVAAGALLAALQAERRDHASERIETQRMLDELSVLARGVAQRSRYGVSKP